MLPRRSCLWGNLVAYLLMIKQPVSIQLLVARPVLHYWLAAATSYATSVTSLSFISRCRHFGKAKKQSAVSPRHAGIIGTQRLGAVACYGSTLGFIRFLPSAKSPSVTSIIDNVELT